MYRSYVCVSFPLTVVEMELIKRHRVTLFDVALIGH